MALTYTNFCCRSGGSNLNAGTRTGDTTEPGTGADITYASGTWVQATRIFTPASGDPVADGVAVGDFVSVYADGSSATGYVARVTARDTLTITTSATALAGTAPTDGVTTRTLKVGGAWAGPNGASPWIDTFPAAVLTNVAGDPPRLNFKNDTTYSITAAMTLSTGDCLNFAGYTSAFGDGGKATIDGGTTGASYVLLTLGGTAGATNIEYMIFGNNGATGSANGVTSSANGVRFFQCVVHDVRGKGFSNTLNTLYVECEAYLCNTSNTAAFGAWHNTSNMTCLRCISHDNAGTNASGFRNAGTATLVNCVADTNGEHGFISSSAGNFCLLVNCDSYNNTADGANVLTALHHLDSSNFVKNTLFGVNGTTGTYAATYNCGFGKGTQVNGSGDTDGNVIETGSVDYADDATPWTAPTTGDFSITLAAAKNAGRGVFVETQASYTGTVAYPDIGAGQANVAASAGSARVVMVANIGTF